MNLGLFTKWVKWENRNLLANIKLPGVYCIAISNTDLTNTEFRLIPDIKYVGMSNALMGLKSRLKQFDNGILGKSGHGGAERFSFKHSDYITLTKMLYVSTCAFECDVASNKPGDLRIMGEVAKLEYDCLARYVELFDQLPEFNDKKLSKKRAKVI